MFRLAPPPSNEAAALGRRSTLDELDIRVVVPRPKRVLIDWDWEASGIWLVGSTSSQFAGPWSDVLSAGLLDEPREWNNAGDEVSGRTGEPDPERLAAFWQRGRQLAERVQEQLGPEWEVPYHRGNDGGAGPGSSSRRHGNE